MKIKKFGATLILPALGLINASNQAVAQAQAPAASAQSVVPLEMSANPQVATPQTPKSISSLPNQFGQGFEPPTPDSPPALLASPREWFGLSRAPAIRSSPQTPPARRRGLARLLNPYEWSTESNSTTDNTSLFGLWRQRRAENEIIIPPTGGATITDSRPPGFNGYPAAINQPSQEGMPPSAFGQKTREPVGTTPSTSDPYLAANPTEPGAPSTPPLAETGTAPPTPSASQPAAAAETGATAPSAASTAAASTAAAAATADTGMYGPGIGGGLAATRGAITMIGDMNSYRLNPFSGISARALGTNPASSSILPPTAQPPTPPSARASQIFYPSVRIFKIAENMSPRPQDRFFFDMNNYWQVNQDINKKFDVPVKNITAYRYFFGFEKTFNEGKGSVGLRFPVDSISGTPTAQGVRTPGSTTTGNLSIFAKYILEENKKTGSLISAGLAITPQTGPSRFAGASWIDGLGSTTIQPFIGYIWNRGDFYLHGFSAFDFSVNVNDVSLMYNDVGIGYYLIRSDDPDRFLTALAPTFELHVNSPLNHRDWYKPHDLAGTADVVNLTYGFNFEFKQTAVLSTALITPMTSPKPFTAELAVLLNIYYGRTRASRARITPPPLF